MSSEKIIIVLVAVACICTTAQAAAVRELPMVDVINKTTCPIRVHINENMDRTPMRIKELKCANNPQDWCTQQHLPKHECCEHKHALSSDSRKMTECVEIKDTVLVMFKNSTEPVTIQVAVGCVCVAQNAAELSVEH